MARESNRLLDLAGLAARLAPTSLKRGLYRIPWLARFIRGSLNRAAPQGLTTIRVAAGGLQDARLLLDLQTEKDYWLGTYEPELQSAITTFIRPGMVVYDVGANIGYISLLFARATGANGRVFAFEALPANQERLRQNLVLNEWSNTVEVIPAAVVEAVHPVQFLVGPSGGMGKAQGSAGRQEVVYPQAIEVAGLSLDEFVHSQGYPVPQVVKMDIEGGEVLALPGMHRLLHETPPLIFLELHGPQAAQVAWDMLYPVGYRLCRMASGYPSIPSLQSLDWKAYVVAMPPKIN